MKIIAYYLPQFHSIPENDKWWGKGFTEWTNVKSAKPIYDGHEQPRLPLNDNFYNLLDDDVKIWQANLAKKYGIYGFCYYHYWFGGKLLLEKPMEQMLNNKKIDIPFCICWANEAWTKRWVGKKKVLIPQYYGGTKEWEDHFNYLEKFFRDDRYIYIDGEPIIIIYKPSIIPSISKMVPFLKKMAIKKGFKGLKVMCMIHGDCFIDPNARDYCKGIEIFDNYIDWTPPAAILEYKKNSDTNSFVEMLKFYYKRFNRFLEQRIGFDINQFNPLFVAKNKMSFGSERFTDVNILWNNLINKYPFCSKNIPGAFIRVDNTPRYKREGAGTNGENPENFYNFIKNQILHTRNDYKKDMIFFYAWNEWAEGGILEPDNFHKYDYLEAIKKALLDTNEFPTF